MDADAGRCPLCGEGNACALADGRDVGRCWCVREVFPASLLDEVPEADRARVCICAACARAHRERAG